MPDPDDFVWAYDTRGVKPGETAPKLPHKIPRNHLRIFKHLSITPTEKAAARRQTPPPAQTAQTTED
jgi:hypothetical protein